MNTAEKRSEVSSQRSVLLPLVGGGRSTSRQAVALRGARPWSRVRPLMVTLALILGIMLAGPAALAHAPALATATSDVALRAAPSPEAAVLALLLTGTEVELTGNADGAFLEVSSGDHLGWAEADGLNGSIATASVLFDVTLRAAPSADSEDMAAVPAGGTVILTGAAVDGFLAASFAGTGGWLPITAVV